MSHPEQRKLIDLVKTRFPQFFKGGKVVEIGSLDINGTIRRYFETPDYTGVDVGEGAGVDLVAQGQMLEFPTGHFDTTISCECLEHNPFWSETVANMMRMTRPGGLVIMTCASTGRPEHGTTRSLREFSPLTNDIGWDYYRNVSARDLQRAINLEWWLEDYILTTNWNSNDLYLIGLRKGSGSADDAVGLAALRADIDELCRSRDMRDQINRAAGLVLGDPGLNGVRALRRMAGKLCRKAGLFSPRPDEVR